ncbi:hypothetical protein ACTJKN_19700 [Pedobacter sp. 22163]
MVRVAERREQKQGLISFPVLRKNGIEIIEIAEADPALVDNNPNEAEYNKKARAERFWTNAKQEGMTNGQEQHLQGKQF